ncbi:hypothetical protein L5515_012256 [Caenorhabditis briggsae]|uniref:Secreted protein n=1 Tax=Caenorhabditis briggsae TaxID=6238 RepID=A0AAE9EXQ5_CAEBR|nr:hypothetical protein L5515_012256 [Caenorhabditis briggsae]
MDGRHRIRLWLIIAIACLPPKTLTPSISLLPFRSNLRKENANSVCNTKWLEKNSGITTMAKTTLSTSP